MNEDTSVFVLKLWGNRQARRNFLSNVPSLGGRESVLTSNVYHRGRMIAIQATYSISGIHIHSPFSRRDTEAKVFKKWSLKFCSRHVFIYCYRVWIGYIYTVIRSVHYLRRTDSLERPWSWGRLKTGKEGDDRGWDGWMASPTPWTWIWANSGIWGRTGKPGMLQSMGSQRGGHDWATEQLP